MQCPATPTATVANIMIVSIWSMVILEVLQYLGWCAARREVVMTTTMTTMKTTMRTTMMTMVARIDVVA